MHIHTWTYTWRAGEREGTNLDAYLVKHQQLYPEDISEEQYTIVCDALDKERHAHMPQSADHARLGQSSSNKERMSAHNQTPHDRPSCFGHSHAASSQYAGAHHHDAERYPASDKESSSASDAQSSPASTTRKNIKWNVIDECAPSIIGNSKLNEVAQMCGLKRIKTNSNKEYATFSCNKCGGFHRRAMWDAKVPRDQRNITIHVPSVPHMQGHTKTCARASDPWALTYTEVRDGTAMTIQGKATILEMVSSGDKPEDIALAINRGRRNGLFEYNNWFKRDITAKQVSNISQYEKKKISQGSNAALAVSLNSSEISKKREETESSMRSKVCAAWLCNTYVCVSMRVCM
jgi:hypothetical protein